MESPSARRGSGSGSEIASLELDHLVIAASDWERTRAFYARVVGAEPVEFDSGRRALRVGETQLNVHLAEDLPRPGEEAINLARIPVAPGGSDLCFRWPGPIADAVEHLERLGVEVELGPVPRPGARGDGESVYFRDPDASLLELISYDR
ncbi:MAG TPA: VOC family protein [Solirubrobacterales bacterium]|nr:VOC family protein [Solirubrobacterales bacterium]